MSSVEVQRNDKTHKIDLTFWAENNYMTAKMSDEQALTFAAKILNLCNKSLVFLDSGTALMVDSQHDN